MGLHLIAFGSKNGEGRRPRLSGTRANSLLKNKRSKPRRRNDVGKGEDESVLKVFVEMRERDAASCRALGWGRRDCKAIE